MNQLEESLLKVGARVEQKACDGGDEGGNDKNKRVAQLEPRVDDAAHAQEGYLARSGRR